MVKDIIKKDIGEILAMQGGERTIRVVATKQVVDRDGDLVMIDGIDTTEYMRNPVVLWMHDQKEEPIGKCTEIVKTVGTDGIPQLEAVIEFAETDDGNDALYLYRNGYLNAVSICFKPVDMKEVYIDGVCRGYDVTSSILYEISAVNIPANGEALIIKGLVRKAIERDALAAEMQTIKQSHSATVKHYEKRLEEIAGMITGTSSPEQKAKESNTFDMLIKMADEIAKKKKEN